MWSPEFALENIRQKMTKELTLATKEFIERRLLPGGDTLSSQESMDLGLQIDVITRKYFGKPTKNQV